MGLRNDVGGKGGGRPRNEIRWRRLERVPSSRRHRRLRRLLASVPIGLLLVGRQRPPHLSKQSRLS
jgi:hypothetical protein